jgi:hypothetical protein
MVMNELYKVANKDKEVQTELLNSMCDKLDKLVELKDTQIENQAQFKLDWMKSKKRGTYFTGITFLLMSSAIALDVVQIEDLSIIIERVTLLLSAWGV